MDLRIVQIDRAFETWNQKLTRQVVDDIFSLKFESYDSHFRKMPFVPIDGNDFVGSHVAVGFDLEGRFVPLLAWKGVRLSHCQQFRTSFPPYALVACQQGPQYKKAIDAFVNKCHEEGEDVGYFGALAISTTHEMSPELVKELFDIFYATGYFFQRDEGLKYAIISATMKFGTQKTFRRAGYHTLKLGDEGLEPFYSYSAGDEPLTLFYSQNEYSKYVMRKVVEYEKLWVERVQLKKEGLIAA